MERFAYAKSKTAGHAAEQLKQDARIKGGGTDLLAQMKRDLVAPKKLVSVEQLAGMRSVTITGRLLRIGAATRLNELARFLAKAAIAPGLQEAAEHTATPGIRNLGTVAGNLLQENRCFYLHDPLVACPKKQNSETCPAPQGPNHESAILGAKNCHSTNNANLAPILCALDAQLVVSTGGEEKRVALRSIWQNEDDRLAFAPRLPQGQIVHAIEADLGELATAHCEVRQKASYDWATAITAVALRIQGGVIADVRIWLGAVAAQPWHAEEAEKLLRGKKPSEALFAEAAELTTKEAAPLAHGAYKVGMTKHACRQALQLAHTRARTL